MKGKIYFKRWGLFLAVCIGVGVQAGTVILEDNFSLTANGGSADRGAGKTIDGTYVDTVGTGQVWFDTATGAADIRFGAALGGTGYIQDRLSNGDHSLSAAVALPTANLQNTLAGGEAVRLTTSVRAGEAQWVSVGLWDDAGASTSAFSQGKLVFLAEGGGGWTLRNFTDAAGAYTVLASGAAGTFSATDFVTFQVDWFKSSNTVDFYVGGSKVVDQLDLDSVETSETTTGITMDIDHVGVHFFNSTEGNTAAVDYVKVEVIPEPATIGMLLTGSTGLLLVRRFLSR